jgi:hypothetical protein
MITTHDVMKGWFSIYSTVFLNRMGPINFTAFSIPAGTPGFASCKIFTTTTPVGER